MSNELDTPKDPLEALSKRERYALDSYRAGLEAPLAPSLNAKFFALYLMGKSTEEIRKMNPQYTLGQIVDARVSGDWDNLKEEHLRKLLQETMGRVQQVAFEGANLLLDLLQATDNEELDHIRKYAQSKNPDDLGRIKIADIRDYKRVVETVQRLLGQDKSPVNVTVPISNNIPSAPPTASRPPTASEAADFLTVVAGGKKD